MSAKVTLGELLRIAPSVRHGVSALLDGYDRAAAANLCSVDSAEDIESIEAQQMAVKISANAEVTPE